MHRSFREQKETQVDGVTFNADADRRKMDTAPACRRLGVAAKLPPVGFPAGILGGNYKVRWESL